MQQRGWGPFTGRQLTFVVCTFLVLVMFPVGAWAVSGSNSFITDATSGKHAKVDGKQNVSVALRDSATATAAKVDSAGRVSTIGDVAAPNSFLVMQPMQVAGDGASGSGPPPDGKALIVTS